MRILVVTYEYPPIGGGGGRAAQDICSGLIKHGHEVRVLTARLKGLPREENINGLRIYRIPSGRRHAFRAGLGAMGGFVLAGFLAGLKMVRKWRPDVMHVHFAVPTGPVAWGLSRVYKIPYVLTAHLGDVPGGVPEKTDRWFRFIYPFTHPIWRDAAQIAAVSDYTRQLAARHYPVPIEVVHNGVDLNRLDPGEIKVNNPPQIVFAGRFMPQKNPLQIVKTLSEVQDLPWHCTMLGDGPLHAEVQAAVKAANLESRFTLPGWVSPEDVIARFTHSDLLFMPSLSEGLPVVGVQSLAMGLAIVCGKAGGFTDLVDEGKNGYLVSNQHPEKYARALRKLLSDPLALTAFRRASREKAKDFALPTIVAKYEKLYNASVSNK